MICKEFIVSVETNDINKVSEILEKYQDDKRNTIRIINYIDKNSKTPLYYSLKNILDSEKNKDVNNQLESSKSNNITTNSNTNIIVKEKRMEG